MTRTARTTSSRLAAAALAAALVLPALAADPAGAAPRSGCRALVAGADARLDRAEALARRADGRLGWMLAAPAPGPADDLAFRQAYNAAERATVAAMARTEEVARRCPAAYGRHRAQWQARFVARWKVPRWYTSPRPRPAVWVEVPGRFLPVWAGPPAR